MTKKIAAPAFNEGDETKKDTSLRIVSPEDEGETSSEKVSITPQVALDRIELITEPSRLSKFARTLNKHGLINVAKGVPYYEKGALTPVEGVEESQEIINALLARRKQLSDTAPVISKATDTPVKKNEKELRDELIVRAIESIPSTKDQKELEVRAYALHQAGVIIKTNTDRGYAVKSVEGVEDSQKLVDLISLKKKEFHVNNLIQQVEKADNKQDVLKVFRQAVIRCFLNDNHTHKPEVPGSAQLLQTIEYKLKAVKKEKPLTHTLEDALKKF